MKQVDAIKQHNARRASTNPVLYRELAPRIAIQELDAFHEMSRLKYLYAMIHPEEAVTQGLQVKLYSDLPVPTNSAGIRETFYVTPSSSGTIALAWNPNYFASDIGFETILTQQGSTRVLKHFDYAHLFYNNSAALDGTSVGQGDWHALPSYKPQINIQQYRIVSALMRVSYVGNLMNQAGVLYSCATTADVPPLYYFVTDEANHWTNLESINLKPGMEGEQGSFTLPGGCRYAYAQLSRFSDFNLVKNGMWNYSHNITERGGGIECLYVPLDAMDTTFRQTNMYYNDGSRVYDSTNSTGNYTVLQPLSANTIGSPLKYVVVGQNLPSERNCIMVEVFYNFECIADPSVSPFLRSSTASALTKDESTSALATIAQVARNGNLIRPTAKKKLTFEDFVRSIPGYVSKAKGWVRNIKDIVSALFA